MRKTKLRTRLETTLSRNCPDAVWALLEGEGYVHAAETESGGFKELVDAARRFCTVVWDLGGPKSGVVPRRRRGAMPHDEHEAFWVREDAVSRFYAQVANELVAHFRKKVLGGETVREPDADLTFLNSAALRCFPLSWFAKHEVSVWDHSASIDKNLRLFVDPPGRWFRVNRDPDYLLTFDSSPRGEHGIWVWRGSVVHRLGQLARRLSGYFGWSDFGAIEFVLTGKVPAWSSITFASKTGSSVKGKKHGNCYARSIGAAITLTVQPWVPAEEVAAAYRTIQRFALCQRRNRSLSTKNLLVFSFVMGKRNLNDEGPSWRSVMDAWNHHCKTHLKEEDWLYSKVQNFWRDYARTKKALLFPSYDVSGFPALGADSADDIEV